MNNRLRVAAIGGSGLLLAGLTAVSGAAEAQNLRFSDFAPLESSAGPTDTPATPITFGNPAFRQRTIVSRAGQIAEGEPNSGDFDMNTVNETGPHQGRYLFTPFESHRSGIQRTDLRTGDTETLFYSPAEGDHIRWDGAAWTPWGTFLTGEEEWCTDPDGCETVPYGRLFELTDPLTADSVTGDGEAADVEHRNVIPRVAHEGLQFDQDWNLYFVDEVNGGGLYRYTPAAGRGAIRSGRAGYFDAGQTSVLRVGDGTTPNATGSYTWVPITDRQGDALPDAVTVTDPRGVQSVDGRNSADAPALKGTDYQRPEDLQIQTVGGAQRLYMNTTTTHETYVLDLAAQEISVFADRGTTDLATGQAVGDGLTNPDNLAVDHDGNVYIVEDRPGGQDDDIWFAADRNHDGDLTDPGEGIGRWASNGTPGSEFTGLYFDPTNKRRAWVDIQHPDPETDGGVENDRTIEITVR